ncbi:MAG: YceI family protein [Chromatiales bacterium]|jgi:polyisoprenoid-binding protein YceI
MKRIPLLLILALSMAAAPAWAEWALDNKQSQLSFISVKKGDIAEVHRFDQLEGAVDDKGNVKLIIQLASVDTAIPIRDERMREMLFNTNAFPTAVLTAKVDAAKVSKLKVGQMMVDALEGQLNLHGQVSPVTAELVIARLGPETLLVSSRRPLVLQAGDFKLVEGVEKLREVAGLPSISNAVPVSFVLTFDQR